MPFELNLRKEKWMSVSIYKPQLQNNQQFRSLDLIIDKILTFKKYIDNLNRKAQYKLHTLRRIRKFLTIEKAKIPVMLL